MTDYREILRLCGQGIGVSGRLKVNHYDGK